MHTGEAGESLIRGLLLVLAWAVLSAQGQSCLQLPTRKASVCPGWSVQQGEASVTFSFAPCFKMLSIFSLRKCNLEEREPLLLSEGTLQCRRGYTWGRIRSWSCTCASRNKSIQGLFLSCALLVFVFTFFFVYHMKDVTFASCHRAHPWGFDFWLWYRNVIWDLRIPGELGLFPQVLREVVDRFSVRVSWYSQCRCSSFISPRNYYF